MRESTTTGNKPCLFVYNYQYRLSKSLHCGASNYLLQLPLSSHKPQTAANVQQLPLNVLEAIKLKLSHNHSPFG